MNDVRVTPRTGGQGAVSRFAHNQDGAVTVDWVALTGFILALGMGTAFYVASSVPRVADKVGENLENTPVLPEG